MDFSLPNGALMRPVQAQPPDLPVWTADFDDFVKENSFRCDKTDAWDANLRWFLGIGSGGEREDVSRVGVSPKRHLL